MFSVLLHIIRSQSPGSYNKIVWFDTAVLINQELEIFVGEFPLQLLVLLFKCATIFVTATLLQVEMFKRPQDGSVASMHLT